MSLALAKLPFAPRVSEALRNPLVRLYVFLAAILALTVPSYAQTPVPLVVPVNDIFIQTNSWLAIFGPIIAIGVGIAVALAILTFVGNQIIKAFH